MKDAKGVKDIKELSLQGLLAMGLGILLISGDVYTFSSWAFSRFMNPKIAFAIFGLLIVVYIVWTFICFVRWYISITPPRR